MIFPLISHEYTFSNFILVNLKYRLLLLKLFFSTGHFLSNFLSIPIDFCLLVYFSLCLFVCLHICLLLRTHEQIVLVLWEHGAG